MHFLIELCKMINKLTQKIAFILFKLNLFVRRNYLLRKLLYTIGIESLFYKFIRYHVETTKEIYFEDDISGTKIKVIDGTPRHNYYHQALRGKRYEPAVVSMLKKLLIEADSPTFVDIGAHIGYFTVYAGNLLGRRGSVISIEPNRDYYRQLLKNIEINCLQENTKTFQIALSNKTCKAEMGGWEDRDLIEFERGKIDVMTFDQLCEIEGIKPDIIKIDVHGAEYKVLSGMTSTLDNHVKHLLLETHSEDVMQGYNIPDVINFFDSTKFELFKLNDFRLNMRVEIVPIDDYVHADTMLYIRRR